MSSIVLSPGATGAAAFTIEAPSTATSRVIIVPRSLGGSNDKDNLISLTPRQHYIAHWMLWKACGGVAGRSFFMMSNLGKYGKVNSTTYAQAKENYSEQVKKQMAERPNRPAFTPEHREKLRQAKLGTKLSAETKCKVGNAQRGRKLSDETKRKISATKKQAFLKYQAEGGKVYGADEATQ